MAKIFTHVAGNTLDSHEKFIEKLTKKGAKFVDSPENSDVTIVFCPIISRFESDITAALNSAAELGCREVIVVAMHHTFNKDFTLPSHRDKSNPALRLVVNCLFFETKGLLSCSCNKKAVEMVCNELGLKKTFFNTSSWKLFGRKKI